MISDGTVCLKLMRMYVLLAILSLLVKGNKDILLLFIIFKNIFAIQDMNLEDYLAVSTRLREMHFE